MKHNDVGLVHSMSALDEFKALSLRKRFQTCILILPVFPSPGAQVQMGGKLSEMAGCRSAGSHAGSFLIGQQCYLLITHPAFMKDIGQQSRPGCLKHIM